MKFPIAIGALKPNHFEETYPEEGSDSGAIEVRLTPRSRGFGIDDIDVGEETHGSSGSQASNANRRGKTLVYWMWWGLGVSASFVFFVTAITVGVKRQQQKKIAAAAMLDENCLDVSVRLDSDEQPAPMDLVPVPAAAPVDDAAGAVPSPFAAFGQCTPGGPGCLNDGTTCHQPPGANICDTCCSCNSSTGNPKECLAAETLPPTQCVIQSPSCISTGNSCNSAAACRGTGNSACCSCAATECPLTQNGNGDWYCTASNDEPSQCPSSAPSRMVSVICIAI
jgi:hypothetical protein